MYRTLMCCIFLMSPIICLQSQRLQFITICTKIGFDDCQYISYGDCECYNLYEIGLSRRIMSVNTYGRCVTLYSEDNCKGDCLRVAPGTPSHDDLSNPNNNFGNKTVSLRACF